MPDSAVAIIAFTIGACASYIITYNILSDSKDHRHCNQKISAERTGRINAEKTLRSKIIDKISCPTVGYPLLVIGNVKSPFVARRGTPRQGLLVPDSHAIVTLSNDIPIDALLGLDGYSHMFVQFLFHENTNLVKTLLNQTSSGLDDASEAALKTRSSSTKATSFTNKVHSFASKVLPPLLNGGSIGLFATRSPHRPNALGLSLVKIVSVDVEKRSIVVSGGDFVDGTPVVDLKPWGPFDCPHCIHNVVDHDGILNCNRDLRRCSLFDVRIPKWVEAGLSHPYKLPIEWTDESKEAVMNIVNSGKSAFYKPGEYDSMINAVAQMLSLDIRSVHRGRGKGPESELIGEGNDGSSQKYEVDYDVLHIEITVLRGNHPIHIEKPWISVDKITEMEHQLIFYKFKAAKDFDTCKFDGAGISCFDAKKEIMVAKDGCLNS